MAEREVETVDGLNKLSDDEFGDTLHIAGVGGTPPALITNKTVQCQTCKRWACIRCDGYITCKGCGKNFCCHCDCQECEDAEYV